MWHFLNEVWRFEYAVVPCFLAYLVFDFPIIYRRITRRLYVPIYFAFFPFGFSDELYARYFDEDDFNAVGGPFHKNEVKNARIKILYTSVISLIITMSISPFLAALFSHYFLSTNQQAQFFYTLAIVKFLMLIWSLYDFFWGNRINKLMSWKSLAIIYAVYWIALLTIFDRGLNWVAKKDELGGIYEIANSLLDFFVFDIGVGIILVVIVGFFITWHLTNGTAKPIEDDLLNDEK